MSPDRTLVSPATAKAYVVRFRRLRAAAAKVLGVPEAELGPGALVGWLEEHRFTLRPASWRQYRAAVGYTLQRLASDRVTSPLLAEEARMAMARLLRMGSAACVHDSRVRRTSAQKQRHLRDADFERLVAALNDSRRRYANDAVRWLAVGRLTGLRPGEWRGAELKRDSSDAIQGGSWMLVLNAKNTQGRAHGPDRILILSRLTEDQLDAIADHIARIRRAVGDGSYEKLVSGCQEVVHDIARALWPRRKLHPSLYSGRHQFIADAKYANLTQEEIAALAGHASTETAARHYGRRHHGQGGFGVRAHERDRARVRTWAEQKVDRPRI